MFTVNSLNDFVFIYIKKLDIIKKTKKGLKKGSWKVSRSIWRRENIFFVDNV